VRADSGFCARRADGMVRSEAGQSVKLLTLVVVRYATPLSQAVPRCAYKAMRCARPALRVNGHRVSCFDRLASHRLTVGNYTVKLVD
jgi:hypothetical protein